MKKILTIVNIHEAKTQLSRLIAQAMEGEAFIIAKAGKPLVKVMAIDATPSQPSRLGFMAGVFSVPDNFDSLGASEIEKAFAGEA